jgi:2-(1,2-epoxy-1,2-dihydrophenyl)acetyl-CoA isomerase
MSDGDLIVLVENTGGVRTITLNRPDRRNAFNGALIAAVEQAVREADEDEAVRCLVITGAGRAFCSGQDLAELADRYRSDASFELGRRLCDEYNPMILRIRKMEKPVIAAVNGPAVGAGCSLALACDLRVAAESASLTQGFVHVGLVPGSGSTFMLPRLVGASRAAELAFTGRPVRAAEALQIGLVNRVVPDGQLAAETAELAQQLADLPTRAIALTKQAINAAWTADLETQLALEAKLQSLAAGTRDHREGVLAFLEKRPPRFEGR